MNNKKDFLPALTGLRAVAAFMVFIHHYDFFSSNPFGTLMHKMANEFHLGVSIFFVLSGFLIYYTYGDLNPNSPASDVTIYIKKRIARIYPVYLLVLIINFIVGTYSPDFKLAFLNFTMTQAFFENSKFSGIPQSWSLTVEMVFYAVAPLIFILHNNGARLWLMWLLILLTGVFFVQLNTFYPSFFGHSRFMIIYTFFGRVTEFFVGIYTAKLVSLKQSVNIRKITWVAIFLMAFITLLISLLSSQKYPWGIFHPAGMFLNNIVFPLAVSLLIFGLVNENSIVKTILGTKYFVLLGSSSYIFYLIHIGVFQNLIDKYISHNTLLIFFILNMTSIFIYMYYEKPLYNIICRKVSKGEN